MCAQSLKSATELAAANTAHFPNESAEYRAARNALLAEEIELRRHLERVAAQRRALPPGGAVTGDYRFEGARGSATLSDLFGDKQTLIVYKFMYGPERKALCPMCANVMNAWDGNARDIEQNVSFVMVARSPIERILQCAEERGWRNLRLYSDPDGDFTRDYVSAEDADVPGYAVFTRRDGTIRHFWSGEISGAMSDPGQDPRGAPDVAPLWNVLDTTPEGRDPNWYPSLSYER